MRPQHRGYSQEQRNSNGYHNWNKQEWTVLYFICLQMIGLDSLVLRLMHFCIGSFIFHCRPVPMYIRFCKSRIQQQLERHSTDLDSMNKQLECLRIDITRTKHLYEKWKRELGPSSFEKYELELMLKEIKVLQKKYEIKETQLNIKRKEAAIEFLEDEMMVGRRF